MAAMSHMNAQGWTPLHVLCSGSDEWGHQAELITLLLESDTVELDFFDTMLNAKVIVFCFLKLRTYIGPQFPLDWAPPYGTQGNWVDISTVG